MRQVLVFLGIAIVFALASRSAMACMCGGGGGTGFDPLERSESLRITLERPTHTVRIVIHKTSLRD